MFVAKTDRNYVFICRKTQILNQIHIIVVYINFSGFLKNIKFHLKIQKGFTENASLRQKLTETLYFLVITPEFQIGYT
jgi:hypothetical protein